MGRLNRGWTCVVERSWMAEWGGWLGRLETGRTNPCTLWTVHGVPCGEAAERARPWLLRGCWPMAPGPCTPSLHLLHLLCPARRPSSSCPAAHLHQDQRALLPAHRVSKQRARSPSAALDAAPCCRSPTPATLRAPLCTGPPYAMPLLHTIPAHSITPHPVSPAALSYGFRPLFFLTPPSLARHST